MSLRTIGRVDLKDELYLDVLYGPSHTEPRVVLSPPVTIDLGGELGESCVPAFNLPACKARELADLLNQAANQAEG